ncbi:MAG: TonB-dependent receptor [Sphingomonadales bacterium]|nr:TonB-dependent receptor [Sphingomonadales bacterium]
MGGTFKTLLCASASVSALTVAGLTNGVSAQDTDALVMEQIVVTVDRRTKDIQDYSGTADVYNQEQLDLLGVTGVEALGTISPGLHVGEQEGNVELYVRGIGSDNNTELGDPATAVYFNGIYIPRPRGVGAMFFDIERLELNRGPQGTLRGRNATAGALNVVTKRPGLQEWEAEVEGTLGNFDLKAHKAMVNIPLGDTLAIRIASFSENHDPFAQNVGPVQDLQGFESANDWGIRGSVLWEPNEKLSVFFIADYLEQGGTGTAGYRFENILAAGIDPDSVDPYEVVLRGHQGLVDFEHYGFAATILYDFGPVIAEYSGSHRDMTYFQITGGQIAPFFDGIDLSDGNIDNFGWQQWYTTSNSEVHELRFFAPDSARFRWTAGGFYFNEDQQAQLANTADKGVFFAGVDFTMPDVQSESWALYADGTFDVTDRLRVLAGIRYSEEDKSRVGIGSVWLFNLPADVDGDPLGCCAQQRFGTPGIFYALPNDRTLLAPTGNPFENFLDAVANFGSFDDIDDLIALRLQQIADGDLDGSVDASGITAQVGENSDSYVDWRAGIEYDVGEDNLLYLTVSTGHKAGGFNDNFILPSGTSTAPTFGPESLTAIEIGSKNRFEVGDLPVTFNMAAFYYDYQDQVFQTVVEIADVGNQAGGNVAASAQRFNAADSTLWGIEMEADILFPNGFEAGVEFLYLNAEFDSATIRDSRVGFGAGDSPLVDLSGNKLPKAPELTVNFRLGHSFDVSTGTVDWLFSGQYRSEHFMLVFNGEGFDTFGNPNPVFNDRVDGYFHLDLGAGYTHGDGRFRLEAFVSNLTNEIHMTSLINTPGLNQRFFNSPRQWGFRLRIRV